MLDGHRIYPQRLRVDSTSAELTIPYCLLAGSRPLPWHRRLVKEVGRVLAGSDRGRLPVGCAKGIVNNPVATKTVIKRTDLEIAHFLDMTVSKQNPSPHFSQHFRMVLDFCLLPAWSERDVRGTIYRSLVAWIWVS